MYFYDCYDENKNYITQIFAKNYQDLHLKVPEAKWVKGFDFLTRQPKWHNIEEYLLAELHEKLT